MATVTVENIVIKIGKKEIALNLEEARELLSVLENTLGKKVEIVERIIDRYHYDYWKIRPYEITWGSGTGNYPPGTILCSLTK